MNTLLQVFLKFNFLGDKNDFEYLIIELINPTKF